MDKQKQELIELLRRVDHTLLRQTATVAEMHTLIDEAVTFGCATVCLPSAAVREAVRYAAGRVPVCTVVGFPNGYETTAAKRFMTQEALADGALEIDMVVNLGWVRDGFWDRVEEEIRLLKTDTAARLLKVIVETSLLTEEEKIQLCGVVTRAGADFIKTSTGFAGGGATPEDVRLFRRYIGPAVKIKAAGGIRSIEDAVLLREAGAERLGTSRLVALARELL